MRRAAAVAALAALLPAARAAAAPEVAVDPRLELLGVVARLAGAPSAGPEDPDYARAVDARFGPFRGHPAVRLYAEIARGGADPLGVTLLYYTDPPELSLADPQARVPFLEGEGDRQRVARFVEELRDFARASDFAGFFRGNAARYRAAQDAARAELGPMDPEGALEHYAGLGLGVRRRCLLSLLYQPGLRDSFIIPYPDPATLETRPAGFEADTLFLWAASKAVRARAGVAAFSAASPELWQESVFVLVEPALWTYERFLPAGRESFYGPALAACRGGGPDCVKGALVAALLSRLTKVPPPPGTPERDLVLKLVARLKEYEKDRARWPTLWDFWPRLMSAFPEAAGLPVPPPAVLPPVARASDFFAPAFRARLPVRP